MIREEAKELLPIIQAFAEGKTIEFRLTNEDWQVANSPTWKSSLTYRIKPEPKYRPFKNNTECWEEMHKHQPFGWLKNKESGNLIVITKLSDNDININGHNGWNFKGLMRGYTFADGEPFGIKEE